MKTHSENDKIKKDYDNSEEYDDKFNIEDTTKYGEFISTYFAWVPLEKQKEKANKLDKMTKEK